MSNNNSQREFSYTALGLALGLVLGGLLGIIADNMIIFAGGGLVLGLALGYAWENRS